MKLTFIKTAPPSQAVDQIDLDLVPVMSVFLILLPFLIAMAVLTHLSILQFSLPPNVDPRLAGAPGEKPKVRLTVVVTPAYVLVTRGEALLDSLPVTDGALDADKFSRRLGACRDSLDTGDEVVVASADRVPLRQLVPIMDRCREAGFDKVGLSSAAVEADGGGTP